MSLEARKAVLLLSLACAAGVSNGRAEPADLRAWSGGVVYLDFWASWCVPCRQSFPWMQRMTDAYSAHGLTIVAVNLDRNRADADGFLAKFHPTFQVRFDPGGEWAEQFKIHGMPTSVIIDRQGQVRFTHVGFLPSDSTRYQRQIEQLLAEPDTRGRKQ